MLLARFFYSGQTTHTVELARALARKGHSVSVLTQGRCHLGAWKSCSKQLKDEKIDALRAKSEEEALAFARDLSPDVVHIHSSDLIPLGQTAGRVAQAPVIFTSHGLGVGRSSPLVKKVDRVIAVGPRIYRDLLEAGVSRVSLVANGVDTERFRPGKKARNLQVIYLGRVDASKRRGLTELIEAVSMVPGAHLIVASNERPQHPSCTSLGWVWDVAPLLASSHVVVGAGRGIREGMAAGCIGLVLNATYGGVVSPAALAKAEGGSLWFSGADGDPPDRQVIRRDLLRLAQDERNRRALAKWSREYACRHFSIDQMAEEIVSVYLDALSARRVVT